MSAVVPLCGVFGEAGSGRRLAYTLLASVLVHTGAVALAPGFRTFENVPPPPLQVVILPRTVPELIREEPVTANWRPLTARAGSLKPEPRQTVTALASAPAASVSSLAPAPTAIQTLAESPAAGLPAFTLPQAAPGGVSPEEKESGPSVTAVPSRGTEIPAVTPPLLDAAYLNNAKPRYPLFARRNGIEGTVYLRVVVSTDGRALQVSVHRSSGSAVLDNEALTSVRGYKFIPARRGQERIEQSVTVPIVFKLDEAS